MEAFSLLKYWRSNGGGSAVPTIATTAAVSPYSSDGEEGPFFDLEFALNPNHECDVEEEEPSPEPKQDQEKGPTTENQEDETDESESEADDISVHENDEDVEEGVELNVTLSPSDELSFKGDLVSIEPSSIMLNGSEENSKIPVFLVKSATKFRVLLLKLKKSKTGDAPEKAEKDEERESRGKGSSKFLALKFKVEEAPSLFTRDTSSKENNGSEGLKPRNVVEEDEDSNASSDERRLAKEVVQKYLKMVKPFYIRVSKRYVEKLKFSGHLSFPGAKGGSDTAAEKGGEVVAPVKDQPKQQGNNLQAGLKVVRKHLGKSRSASAAVAAASGKVTSNRRDDSLLQVQDGIQGAILHCKRSFNAFRDAESSSILCRSASDPSYEKSVIMPKGSKDSTTSFSGEAKEIKA